MELIPIALGVIFFLACLSGGFIYGVFLAKGKLRWRGLLIAGVGLIGLLPLLAVSSPPNMSLSSLSGTYEGTFGGGTNTFVLHPNGTYDQEFADAEGKVYYNHGTLIRSSREASISSISWIPSTAPASRKSRRLRISAAHPCI